MLFASGLRKYSLSFEGDTALTVLIFFLSGWQGIQKSHKRQMLFCTSLKRTWQPGYDLVGAAKSGGNWSDLLHHGSKSMFSSFNPNGGCLSFCSPQLIFQSPIVPSAKLLVCTPGLFGKPVRSRGSRSLVEKLQRNIVFLFFTPFGEI